MAIESRRLGEPRLSAYSHYHAFDDVADRRADGKPDESGADEITQWTRTVWTFANLEAKPDHRSRYNDSSYDCAFSPDRPR